MKVGAEDKKKVAVAVALSVVALVTVYVQFFTGDPVVGGAPRVRPAEAGLATRAQPARQAPRPAPRRRVQGSGQAFQPVWERLEADENFNALEADPTLRTDLLAAVRAVEFSRVDRNIFEFTTRQRAVVAPSAEDVRRAAELQQQAERSAPDVSAQPAVPSVPRAPKISWRYYGFANEDDDGDKRAFLLDGTDVLIGGEGDVFKKRYKIIRIDLTQIVIEDMQFDSEQQLAIEVPQG
jgi:hypothetical protein